MSYYDFVARFLTDSASVQTTIELAPHDESKEPMSTTPPSDPGPYEWMESALCAEIDPELFFPTYQGDRVCVKAKKICGQCTVREQCLEQALRASVTDDYGVWGGTTPPEREEIRAERSGIHHIDLVGLAQSVQMVEDSDFAFGLTHSDAALAGRVVRP